MREHMEHRYAALLIVLNWQLLRVGTVLSGYSKLDRTSQQSPATFAPVWWCSCLRDAEAGIAEKTTVKTMGVKPVIDFSD